LFFQIIVPKKKPHAGKPTGGICKKWGLYIFYALVPVDCLGQIRLDFFLGAPDLQVRLRYLSFLQVGLVCFQPSLHDHIRAMLALGLRTSSCAVFCRLLFNLVSNTHERGFHNEA
jgi:hypothetical protein